MTTRGLVATTARAVAITWLALGGSVPAGLGVVAMGALEQPPPVLVDFSQETVGADPKSVVPVVGAWAIAEDAGNPALVVDGRRWTRGVPLAGLADKAKSLYGERYAEFLDNVQAYAYFPYAVAKAVDRFQTGEISLRFKALSGRIDQAAGILFALQGNGDYMVLRANPLENNLVLWRFERGRRSSVKWIRNTPTPSGTWVTLRLVVTPNAVEGYIDVKPLLQHAMPAIAGRVGVLSKADSQVLFDDLRVSFR